MEQPILIPVQLTHVVTADQFAASFTTALSGKFASPQSATLNRIKARARAFRPL